MALVFSLHSPPFFKKKYSFVLLTVDVEFHNLWIFIHGASMYVSL